MILQAIYEYYQRKAADPESGIAPDGYILKRIDFVVLLTMDGSFVELQSLQELNGEKLVGKPLFVPATGKQAEKHTMAGNDANLLWDNSGFVFGVGRNGAKKISSFVECIKRYYPNPPDDVLAIVKYLEDELALGTPFDAILNHPLYGEQINSGSPLITFRVEGDFELITEKTHVMSAVMPADDGDTIKGCCLITGDADVPLALNHMVTKRIVGGQSSGSNLVSFNAPAYCSYSKESSINSPVSSLAASAYTKALQFMIDSGKNSVRLVDTTTVFWAQKYEQFEDMFPAFFGYAKDDPDADVRAVKALYDGVFTGHNVLDEGTKFYVLGLAPNAARLSVRFWHSGTISDFAGKIRQHFDDLAIVRGPKDTHHYAMYWLLSAMAQEGKVDNVPPNLSGQIFQSVITGGSYPITMLQQTLRRIRATQDVSRLQAGILKGGLNRFSRIYKTKEKEITVALDSTNENPGYRLGRLFAVLEKIQEEANPGINATIRDRFYGAASSTPVTVFPQLLKLKNHHLAKLNNTGRKINFEILLADIINGLAPGMPPHLAMEDQARFGIGYYHQRQALFTKSDTNNDKEIKEDNNG